MLDRSIPYFNTILRCDAYIPGEAVLPQGYAIVSYQTGFEKDWAALEYAIGDFPSPQAAEDYFRSAYLRNPALYENLRFLLDAQQQVVGSCIAWQDKRQDALVSSLHWLVVSEHCQGIGLGRALCCDVMNRFAAKGQLPVYLHTQPWSWKAIFLYLSLGFRLQKTDTFSTYTNEYPQAMAALEQVVSSAQFAELIRSSQE